MRSGVCANESPPRPQSCGTRARSRAKARALEFIKALRVDADARHSRHLARRRPPSARQNARLRFATVDSRRGLRAFSRKSRLYNWLVFVAAHLHSCAAAELVDLDAMQVLIVRAQSLPPPPPSSSWQSRAAAHLVIVSRAAPSVAAASRRRQLVRSHRLRLALSSRSQLARRDARSQRLHECGAKSQDKNLKMQNGAKRRRPRGRRATLARIARAQV